MNGRYHWFLFSAIAFCTAAAPATAQQWPRFRGPDGSGESDAASVPTTWTVADYKWRVELPGIGYSSPVVWDQRVFITSANEDDATRIVRCLNTEDGAVLWERQYKSTPHKKNPSNSYATATPALDKDHVYLAWTTPEEYTLLALRHSDGSEAWRRNLGPHVEMHGSGASPIVVGDLVILPNDQTGESFIIAVDCATGATRWQVSRKIKRTSYSTPCIYRGEDGRPQLVFTGSMFGMTSLDPTSGQTNWELEILKQRVVGSPAVAAGLIFATCGEGGAGRRLVAVRPGNGTPGAKAELVYDKTQQIPYVPTPVAFGRLVVLIGDQGLATCMDAPTGEIKWQEKTGGKFFGSPVRVGDGVYCISREGEVFVLAAADQYKLLARIELGEPSQSTPAVADGVMYLRTVSHLMALGGKKQAAGE